MRHAQIQDHLELGFGCSNLELQASVKYRSRILMQLEEFLDFTWQISQVQQELVSFTNPHITQLVNIAITEASSMA